jgi:hypothetical protein
VCQRHTGRLTGFWFLLNRPKGWILMNEWMNEYIQQDSTLHILSIFGNCSVCFGWYFHPSSGAHITVCTASGICHTVTAICRYRWGVVTGLSVRQHTQTAYAATRPNSLITKYINWHQYCNFVTHGSVYHRLHSRSTNKMQLCNRIYHSKVL